VLERFTDDARRVVNDARSLAVTRGDTQIGPLHLLSALITGDSVAAQVLAGSGIDAAAVTQLLGPGARTASGDAEALAAIGINLGEIKRKVEESFGEGALDQMPLNKRGPLNWRRPSPLTEDARSSLVLALREAAALHHNYIGSEHLLLGLLRTAERRKSSGLRQAMTSLGLRYPAVRDQVLDLLAMA